MPTGQRNDIRARIRRMRRDVDARFAADAARQLCARLIASDCFQSARHIGAYVPNDGEIDTWPVIRHAWQAGQSVYLPVIRADRTLLFAPVASNTKMDTNRYGIPEPRHTSGSLVSANELDVVLVPLVAFDNALFRLGMGGGYYDRTFEFVKNKSVQKPRLIGIAYDFQRVETVFAKSWDVPTWRVVTEKAVYEQAGGK